MRRTLLFFLFVVPLSVSNAETESTYEVTAGRATGIVIDGVLEPAWFQGGKVAGLIQRDPQFKAPPAQHTSAWVLSDRDALYVGYMCYDTAPDSILGGIQRRDNDERSDFVDVYLDSFHDRRNGYWYTVTAAGVQAEGTIANEDNFSADWDAVWESAVARNDSGWSCEIRIPYQSIRHGGAREDGWGIFLARRIQRHSESDFWPPVDPTIGFKIGNAAALHGLPDIAPSAHIEVLPHAVGRWDAEAEGGKWHSENEVENLGFYLKAVPGADMTVDFAYQPDFAQVDVDAEVINLNDYPVFFSEKRPFFLENKQIFEETPYTIFYSRRITNPDYAGRVNFQQGPIRASVLGGKNRRFDDRLQDTFAGRMVFNLGRVHRVGLTSTYLNMDGYSARTGAFDARFGWRRVDRLNVWFAAVDRSGDGVRWSESGRPVNDEQPTESRIEYYRDWEFVKTDVAVTWRGTDYDPSDLGWSDFSNVIRRAGWLGDTYFPTTTFLRRIGYDVNAHYETFTDDSHRMGKASYDIYFDTRSNWNAGWGMEWGDWFRRVYADPRDAADIGEFRDNYGEFNTRYYKRFYHWHWLTSDNRKPVEYHHDIEYYKYRDGYGLDVEPEVLWKPRSNIEIAEQFLWSRLWKVDSYNNATTDFQVWITKLRWSPHLDLSFRGTVQYIQYDDAVRTNLLVAWNWNPGSWLYIVYDETNRLYDQLPDGSRLPRTFAESYPGDRTIRAKLTYFFTMP